ncbi:MAG TPA: DUF3306 domain-containing protein [Ramlibacter sp.]|uniref:DUF3306 domain-containing protein n=1 Tax=Ramlibacter sp. TaxID=1917967 RepID=UPI002ED593B5
MADGFLGRWSQRKELARQGKELAPEPEVQPSPQPSPASGRGSEVAAVAEARPVEEPPQLPTLEDVQSLTRDSDFSRFVQPGVAPEVKNAAMKKLFSDPHFNVMDGLDVYIDDYSKPDPIPPEMLRQLASASFLGLFDEKKEEKEPEESAEGRDRADDRPPRSVAQSSNRTEQALPPAEDHADPDLRLQQDDAPGPEGPGEDSR